MADLAGIIFIENYIAGGGDQIARTLIDNLPFNRLRVLVNRGNDARILLAGSLPPHVQIERYGLVTVAELSRWANAFSNPMLRALARGISFALRYPLMLFSIVYFCERLRRINADVFVANNGGYPGGFYCRTATVAASMVPGLRVFHIVHGMAEPAHGVSRPIEWCIDRMIDRFSQLLTVSNSCAERLTEVRSMHQCSGVVYNGIADLSPPRLSESATLRVLHVGYFDWNKNQRLLIEAVAELARRGVGGIEVNFVGTDIGDGCMERCRTLAAALGVVSQVRFSGFIDAVEACYAEADIFVLCSHSEGLPLTILEAMRAGKPVVATDVGGIAEQIVDGVSGFLIPVDDAFALADKLEQLKNDLALRARIGCAARARFETLFTTSKMIAGYMKMLGIGV